jgi:cysteinyl-tRNA synthetase
MRYTRIMNQRRLRHHDAAAHRRSKLHGARLLVATAVAIGLTGCGSLFYSSVPCTDTAETVALPPAGTPVPGSSWVYQLQDAVPADLAAAGADIIVIDYSSDGSADGEYSPAEIDAIRAGVGTESVLAYLSIGEADDYRYYFDSDWVGLFGQPSRDAPCWLGRTNPEWRGNYKVQYWSAGWHQVVLGYLDRIIAAGFDGVYLDIIDGYEYWSDSDNGEGFNLTEREAADRMMNLVLAIAGRARASDTGFLVVPQNGSPIIAYDDGAGIFAAGAYQDTISGIGVEDLYYDETREKDSGDVAERLVYLRQIHDAGTTVLVVDYVDDGSGSTANAARIADFESRATAEGFIPYAARDDRELDEIN